MTGNAVPLHREDTIANGRRPEDHSCGGILSASNAKKKEFRESPKLWITLFRTRGMPAYFGINQIGKVYAPHAIPEKRP
jgi:hypothetical protein